MEAEIIKHLLSKEQYELYSPYLRKDMFTSKVLWNIYRKLGDYFEHNTETISVEALKRLHIASLSGSATSLLEDYENAYTELSEASVSQPTEELVRELRKQGLINEAIMALDEADFDGAKIKFEELERVSEEGDEFAFDPIKLVDVKDDVEASRQLVWFNSQLEELLEGFGPERSCMVFARPNTGKTSFTLAATTAFMKQGKRVLHFCISEDTRVALLERYYQAAYHLKDLDLEEDADYYSDTFYDEFGDKLFIRNVATLSLKEAREAIEACNPDVVVFDQYQKVAVRSKVEMRSDEQLTLVAQKLKELAKEHQFGLICCTQASKPEGKSHSKWLTIDDVAGSKTGVPGEFQIMIGIGADESGLKPVYNPEGEVEQCVSRFINIAKNKGRMGRFHVYLNPETCKWIED